MSRRHRSRRGNRGSDKAQARQPEPVWTDLEQAFFDSAPSEHDPPPAPESFDDLDDLTGQ
ncbi:MAG TPA: hypothetical protein VMT03_21955 [Polyangia bacterium]|nr:hypothetical protein [Polyangia bacterium]